MTRAWTETGADKVHEALGPLDEEISQLAMAAPAHTVAGLRAKLALAIETNSQLWCEPFEDLDWDKQCRPPGAIPARAVLGCHHRDCGLTSQRRRPTDPCFKQGTPSARTGVVRLGPKTAVVLSGIHDPAHSAYSIYAKATALRRENLRHSADELRAHLAKAEKALRELGRGL